MLDGLFLRFSPLLRYTPSCHDLFFFAAAYAYAIDVVLIATAMMPMLFAATARAMALPPLSDTPPDFLQRIYAAALTPRVMRVEAAQRAAAVQRRVLLCAACCYVRMKNSTP